MNKKTVVLIFVSLMLTNIVNADYCSSTTYKQDEGIDKDLNKICLDYIGDDCSFGACVYTCNYQNTERIVALSYLCYYDSTKNKWQWAKCGNLINKAASSIVLEIKDQEKINGNKIYTCNSGWWQQEEKGYIQKLKEYDTFTYDEKNSIYLNEKSYVCDQSNTEKKITSKEGFDFLCHNYLFNNKADYYWIGCGEDVKKYVGTNKIPITPEKEKKKLTLAGTSATCKQGKWDFEKNISGTKELTSTENCLNKKDDDQDNYTDCDDYDCHGQQCGKDAGAVCNHVINIAVTATIKKISSESKSETVEIMGTASKITGGAVTAAKSSCMEVYCNDTIDNDDDGKTDCADSDCNEQVCGITGSACVSGVCTEMVCSDKIDNDKDATVLVSGVTKIPTTGSAIYQQINQTEDTSNSLWSKIKQVLWGNKEARAGKAGEGLYSVTPTLSNDATPTNTKNTPSTPQNSPPTYTITKTITTPTPASTVKEATATVVSTSKEATNQVLSISTKGTDCSDSDCFGKTGPNKHTCCFTASDCPGSGATCTNSECKEISCVNSKDDDGDNETDCADSDCESLSCGTNAICISGSCQKIPEAAKAPTKIEVPKIQIYSYKDILMTLNRCKVRTGSAIDCTAICQSGESGFPTKKENSTIIRCTCC